jgi:hypothetical protein
MEENKKRPIGKTQGDKSHVSSESDRGTLREGRAKGSPSNVKNTGGDTEGNRQINPNESRIMGNPRTEDSRSSDQENRGSSRRGSDSSL